MGCKQQTAWLGTAAAEALSRGHQATEPWAGSTTLEKRQRNSENKAKCVVELTSEQNMAILDWTYQRVLMETESLAHKVVCEALLFPENIQAVSDCWQEGFS